MPRVFHSEGGGFINYSSDISDSYHVDRQLKESISGSGQVATSTRVICTAVNSIFIFLFQGESIYTVFTYTL